MERKGKERKTKEKRKKNQFVGKEGKRKKKGRDKGESWLCTLRFPVFRQSKVDRLRFKVSLLDESYE